MIAQLIEVINTAASTLPVSHRNGLAQIISGAPYVHVGEGQWVPVTMDQHGSWSYVRVNGQTRVERVDIGEACTGARVTIPLRLVAYLHRDACNSVHGLLVDTSSSIRAAHEQVRVVLGAVRVNFSSISMSVDDFKTQEYSPAPDVPTNRVMVALDMVVQVDGREECFVGCGNIIDVVCAVIQAASNDKVVQCLGPARLSELCDAPCEATTVNGQESTTPTITVTQGGEPVGVLDPLTGEVVVDECPPQESCPVTVRIYKNEQLLAEVEHLDPCENHTINVTCDGDD